MKNKSLFKTLIIVIILTSLISTVAFGYQVQSGDMVWKIAEKFNVTIEDIVNANNLEDKNLIFPGQNLIIPSSQQAQEVEEVVEVEKIGQTDKPKYVFYMIGDGLGASQRQLAEFYLEEIEGSSKKLLMNTFPAAGINTTYSADTLVTDSAAAGTALAAGIKTNNGVISQTPEGENVRTLVECAEDAGMATGLVSTTRITHATPATFASHNVNRNDENGIAVDFVDSGVDFFAGGGIRHFIPQSYTEPEDAAGNSVKSKRKDDIDVVGMFSDLGYETFISKNGAAEFNTYVPKAGDQVLALFTYTHMPYEVDRVAKDLEAPSLSEMTEKAIDLLSKDEDGFFLMVEAGRIDHACHANDAKGAIMDTLAFDEAIEEAYEFYISHPEETLIVVVGDHETGGMGLGFANNYFLNMDELEDVDVSVEDTLQYADYDTLEEYLAYIDEHLGLDDLTAEEIAEIESAMSVETGANPNTYGSYYTPEAIAATHLLSERVNIQWTTFAHSATAIPMSAVGKGAQDFSGYKDNTEIAQAMAELMNFNLSR